MKQTLEIGKQYRVRNDLVVGKSYGAVFFDVVMGTYRGKIVTIARESRSFPGKFFIKEDDDWFWTPQMFEDSKEPNIDELFYGGSV